MLTQLIGAPINTDEQMALLGDTTWKPCASRHTSLRQEKYVWSVTRYGRSFVCLTMSNVYRDIDPSGPEPAPTIERPEMKRSGSSTELIALACGILGMAAAVWAYWMILPGVVFGAIAVVLGWRSRRGGKLEGGSVAIALGIAAILLVPSVLFIAHEAERWGRDCALNPTHDPNC